MGFTTLYTHYVYFREFLPSNSICFFQISNMVEYESVVFSSILLYPVFLWWYVLVWHTDTFVTLQANFVKISLRQCSLSASITHAYWHFCFPQKKHWLHHRNDTIYLGPTLSGSITISHLTSCIFNSHFIFWKLFKNQYLRSPIELKQRYRKQNVSYFFVRPHQHLQHRIVATVPWHLHPTVSQTIIIVVFMQSFDIWYTAQHIPAVNGLHLVQHYCNWLVSRIHSGSLP